MSNRHRELGGDNRSDGSGTIGRRTALKRIALGIAAGGLFTVAARSAAVCYGVTGDYTDDNGYGVSSNYSDGGYGYGVSYSDTSYGNAYSDQFGDYLDGGSYGVSYSDNRSNYADTSYDAGYSDNS